MKKSLLNKFFFAFLSIVMVNTSFAFDCKKAKSPTENAICSSNELKALDDKLNSSYQKAIHGVIQSEEQATFKAEQKKWLKMIITDCTNNVDCLIKGYTARVSKLDSFKNNSSIQISATDISFRIIKKTKAKPIELNLEYPEFYGANKELVKKLNQIVFKIWGGDDGCNLEGEDKKESNLGEYQRILKVNKLTPRLIILSDSGSYYCPGAAHPDNFNVDHIISVSTGTEFELWNQLTPRNKSELLALISKKGHDQRMDDMECAETYNLDQLESSTIKVSIIGASVELTPDFPHVIQACEEGFTLPLKEFKKYFSDNKEIISILEELE